MKKNLVISFSAVLLCFLVAILTEASDEFQDIESHVKLVQKDGWNIWATKNFGKIDSISVSRYNPPPTDALLRLQEIKNLNYLRIYCEVSSDLLKGLGKLKSLQGLCLSVRNVDKSIQEELAPLTDLRILSLQKTNIQNWNFLESKTKLKRLFLRNLQVDQKGIHIISKLKNLEYLTIENDDEMMEPDFKQLAELHTLKRLSLHYPGMEESNLEHFHGIQSLESLVLTRISITGKGLHGFSNLKELKLVDVSMTPEGIEAIAGLQKLRSLEIAFKDPILLLMRSCNPNFKDTERFQSTFPLFRTLEQTQQLQSLILVGPKELHGLKSLQNLKHLSIRRTGGWYCKSFIHNSEEALFQISKEDLKTISTLQNLESLELENEGAKSLDFSEMQTLPKLTSLTIVGECDNDSLIQLLQKTPALQKLSLRDASVTDATLKAFLELKCLFTLELSSCRGITDQGLNYITQISTLQTLVLSDLNITDEIMSKLLQLPCLCNLSLSNVPIKKETTKVFETLKSLSIGIEGGMKFPILRGP